MNIITEPDENQNHSPLITQNNKSGDNSFIGLQPERKVTPHKSSISKHSRTVAGSTNKKVSPSKTIRYEESLSNLEEVKINSIRSHSISNKNAYKSKIKRSGGKNKTQNNLLDHERWSEFSRDLFELKLEEYLKDNGIDAEIEDDQFETEMKKKLDLTKVVEKKKWEKDDEAKEDEEVHVEHDEVLESFYNYSVQITGIVYYPYFLIVIWLFYEETVMSAIWGIKLKDYIFYFLFALMIIPFQIVVDILCYNVMNYFLAFDYVVALKKWDKEFQDRTHWWAGIGELDYNLEGKLRLLAKLAFSSQYYFVATYGMSGILFIILGIMTIAQSNYYPWDDFFVFLPVLFNWFLLYITDQLAIKSREYFKIWHHKDNNFTKKEPKKKENDRDDFVLKFNEQISVAGKFLLKQFFIIFFILTLNR